MGTMIMLVLAIALIPCVAIATAKMMDWLESVLYGRDK
jgi:hypothetical protein